MKTNVLPKYDMQDNPTGCCPRFDPKVWDGVELHFEDKPFAQVETKSVLHIPLNMGKVFGRILGKLGPNIDEDNYIALSRDASPWKAKHLFASDTPLEGEAMVTLSGDFVTQVFEGSYSKAGTWEKAMQSKAADRESTDAEVWFFYPTCPKCAKVYGKNYAVGLARV